MRERSIDLDGDSAVAIVTALERGRDCDHVDRHGFSLHVHMHGMDPNRVVDELKNY